MNFLMETERAYVGASSLFEKLNKLGINPVLYVLPLPYIFKPDELLYYTESIRNDLRGKKPDNEDFQYVDRICVSLMAWAEKGYIVHVI